MEEITTKIKADMLNLYLSNEFADIDIIIDEDGVETKIKAHKSLLSVRNDVFKTMFDSDVKESVHGCIYISDISAKTFKTFIKYLYTGEVDLSNVSLELLVLADKYLDNNLKLLCGTYLCSEINIENVIHMFLTAIKCNSVILQEKAVEFIVGHYDDIKNHSEYDLLIQDEIAVESILQMFNKFLYR